jgi:HlyD family secretion protein
MATTPTGTPPPPLTPARPLQSAARRPRRRLRRWLKRGALAAGALAIAGALVRAWLPEPLVVDAGAVQRGPLVVTVDEDGRTRVEDRFVVSAPVGGNLERIELDPGTDVALGAPLARIQPPDPAMLDERSRGEARARLAAALARERQAVTAVRRTRAAHTVAMHEAERARILFARAAIAAAEVERAELAATLADEDRAAAALQRDAAAAEVRAARAVLGVDGAAGAPIDVPAPVTGRVLRVLRDDAGPIAPGTPLIELGDPTTTEVVVDVLSADAARIRTGARVVIRAWGGDVPLAGTVRLVEPAATTRISALGIEEQRVDVVVELATIPPGLGDGFRVEAEIELWRADDVVTVPAGALFRDRGRWAVYTIEDGRARLRAVEVGHRGAAAVEIAGLPPGTPVIVYPSDRVADGARVERRR